MELDWSAIRLYGILDLGYCAPDQLVPVAKQMMAGGVGILQLRAKNRSLDEVERWADQLLPVTREAGVPLVINDHVELARGCGADGVHVGQDDQSAAEVREFMGADKIVGLSTHSPDQARQGSTEPVDYLGFGPLFATPTKPDYQPIGVEDIAAVHGEL